MKKLTKIKTNISLGDNNPVIRRSITIEDDINHFINVMRARYLEGDQADIDFTTSFIVNEATGSYHVHTPILFAIQMNNLELAELLVPHIKPKTFVTTYETLKKIQEARSKLLA